MADNPFSSAQLNESARITAEEREWYLQYSLATHKCAHDLLEQLRRSAPLLAETIRRSYLEGTGPLDEMLAGNMSIGNYLARRQADNERTLEKFGRVWGQMQKRHPLKLPVPSSRSRAEIQKPISNEIVAAEDVNLHAFNLEQIDPTNPFQMAIFGGNSPMLSDQALSAAQVFIKRQDDTFVFRLLIRMPSVSLQLLDTLPEDDNYYAVETHLQKDWISELRLGIVNIQQMQRKQESPTSVVLDSGWIFAPGERDFINSWVLADGPNRETFETNFAWVLDRGESNIKVTPLEEPTNICWNSLCGSGVG